MKYYIFTLIQALGMLAAAGPCQAKDGWPKSISVDDADPGSPNIIYKHEWSILVRIDGEPKLKWNVRWGLAVVANTPFVIVHAENGRFYLYGEGHWYQAPEATGPYVYAEKVVPRKLKEIEKELKMAAAKSGYRRPRGKAGKEVYTIVVTTKPAELVQTDGMPDLVPVEGTKDLNAVTNTDNDLFQDYIKNKFYYYLLCSGKWYRTEWLNDAHWEYVAPDQLPADFLSIPKNSPKASVRASIAGTPEFAAAVTAGTMVEGTRAGIVDEPADSVPGETSRVKAMDAAGSKMVVIDKRTATTNIDYDGPPRFLPIEGTQLQYATNTCKIVIEYSGLYYALDRGIWFISGSPLGPWAVSTSRPDEVDLIPRSQRVYRAKFVYVFDAWSNFVCEGYRPGYRDDPMDDCGLLADYDVEYDPEFVFGWGAWAGGDWWGGAANYRNWRDRYFRTGIYKVRGWEGHEHGGGALKKEPGRGWTPADRGQQVARSGGYTESRLASGGGHVSTVYTSGGRSSGGYVGGGGSYARGGSYNGGGGHYSSGGGSYSSGSYSGGGAVHVSSPAPSPVASTGGGSVGGGGGTRH